MSFSVLCFKTQSTSLVLHVRTRASKTVADLLMLPLEPKFTTISFSALNPSCLSEENQITPRSDRHEVRFLGRRGVKSSKIFCACGSRPSPRYRHQDQPRRAAVTQELSFKGSVIFNPSMKSVHDIMILNIWCLFFLFNIKCVYI